MSTTVASSHRHTGLPLSAGQARFSKVEVTVTYHAVLLRCCFDALLLMNLCPVQARLDSLVERTEMIGSKTIERFEGRDDHLLYRSVRYGPVERQQSDLK